MSERTMPPNSKNAAEKNAKSKSGAKGIMMLVIAAPFLLLILAGVYKLVGNMVGFPTPDFAAMSMSLVGVTPAPTIDVAAFRPTEETARPSLPEATEDPSLVWDDEYPNDGGLEDNYDEEWYAGDEEDQWVEPVATPSFVAPLPQGEMYMAGEFSAITNNGIAIGELVIHNAQLVENRNETDAAAVVFLLNYTYRGLDNREFSVVPQDFRVYDQNQQEGRMYDLPITKDAQPVGYNQQHMAEAYFALDNPSGRVTLVYQYGGVGETLLFDVALR